MNISFHFSGIKTLKNAVAVPYDKPMFSFKRNYFFPECLCQFTSPLRAVCVVSLANLTMSIRSINDVTFFTLLAISLNIYLIPVCCIIMFHLPLKHGSCLGTHDFDTLLNLLGLPSRPQCQGLPIPHLLPRILLSQAPRCTSSC